MKVFKITPDIDANPYIEKEIDNIAVWLEESEIGDKITIDVINMSEEDYNNLPDYMGP